MARVAIAVTLIGAASGALLAADADPTVAAATFLVIVVLTALLRVPAGAVGLVLACIAFDLWFVDPVGSLVIRELDQVATLAAFVVAAAVCGVVVAHLDAMRRQVEVHERATYEAMLDAAINENRAAFLSAMTHNLRTPLASIRTAADTLESSATSLTMEARERLLVTIRDQADQLERLVTKVIELSRVHAGVIKPDREPTDVAELIGSAVRRLRHMAPHHDIHVVVDGEALMITTDPAMLELVLVSLLENAFRFAPPASGIDVCVRRSDARCEIRVVDHGPGIAPQDRDRIFEEFVQLDGRGSGLGLAIGRAFTEALGGSLTVEATSGGGATFVIDLPSECDGP